ncbi:hypothetical protein RhiirA1_541764 [Rhizophagus irregularis]|uniref:Uncharacterized protein n=1 Tax=Rhizophagus irregularis TaxID=588596 RepID=A0A2N0R1E8_9GLOM|nr:hypothetical protein RhiirA1_541764 [Rhizophagus irregularis]
MFSFCFSKGIIVLPEKETILLTHGRQTLTMMDDWIVKRNNLQEEKNELLEEREKIITSEIGNELGEDAQALDDKIKIITSKITYITAKIHSLHCSRIRKIC